MEVALNILSGLAIALATSWFTVFFSLKRFRTEKWWEKKAEAYTSLLSALHNSKAFSEINLSAEMRGRELTDQEDKELREKSRESEAKIYREMDVGAFYLSSKAINRLKLYKKQIADAGAINSWVQYLLDDLEATNSCIKDIVEIAREDLSVKNM